MSASKSHRHDGNDFVNRWDFRCRRNDDRVDAAVTVGGRLFQALVPAAEKDRSPCVDLRVAGTTNADELEDLRRCRDSNCATCCNCSERYAGARLCLHLNNRTQSLYWILSWIRSQWRSISIGVIIV